MTRPRKIFTSPLYGALLFFALLSSIEWRGEIHAQQSSTPAPDDRAQGISSYQQGNDQEAIAALRRIVKRDKTDVGAWHYLGLALERQAKTSDARKAHERAAKAGEALLVEQLDDLEGEELFVRMARIKSQLEAAAASADKYLALSSNPSANKIAEWRDRAALLRIISQSADVDANTRSTTYAPKDVTTKARILSRPEPQYTNRARDNGVRGTVVLRGIFGADGRVRITRIVQGLPDGLTLRCIKAAQQIRFIPATRDGQPVSQYIQIEYNFNIY